MYFAAIVPVENLEQIRGRHAQMCVAPFALKSERYRQFYREESRVRGHVILDNGAWEGKLVSLRDYIDLMVEVKPSVVVVPDVVNDAKMTTWLRDAITPVLLSAIHKHFKHNPSPPQLMTVLQGNTQEITQQYMEVKTEWIAFGGATINRVEIATTIRANKMWRSQKLHHALGMVGGSLEEAMALRDLRFYSIDGLSPLWREEHGPAPFDLLGRCTPSMVTEKLTTLDNILCTLK